MVGFGGLGFGLWGGRGLVWVLVSVGVLLWSAVFGDGLKREHEWTIFFVPWPNKS